MTETLPPYARPLFVRIVESLATTETFKQKLGDLAAEGFDPARVYDPLFFDDARTGAYVSLDMELFEALTRGAMRL
jgi:fatty-acyl-CoA synthase